ncbi:hypothetical protein H920_13942 [Fukomys damarensis]|uniref:Uncharacterized protein n=1 Tax=Fukomys damarensis TaxID=885580 RepID=A0A091D0W5_FUKDA|nr:hypothetical protein H920_13942 [Fukomys damarensis]
MLGNRGQALAAPCSEAIVVGEQPPFLGAATGRGPVLPACRAALLGGRSEPGERFLKDGEGTFTCQQGVCESQDKQPAFKAVGISSRRHLLLAPCCRYHCHRGGRRRESANISGGHDIMQEEGAARETKMSGRSQSAKWVTDSTAMLVKANT